MIQKLWRAARTRLIHLVFWPRYLTNSEIRRFARSQQGSVLEIGSGRSVRGRFPYSAEPYFRHCSFTQSDIVPDFGHRVLDVSSDVAAGFDAILCANVLEHVFDYQSAVANIYQSLDAGGRAFFVVPYFYPLHDEPHDYWRFTEHSLREMFRAFSEINIRPRGFRIAPVIYSIDVKK